MSVFDVIVIGMGANGSSALHHLSKTNKNILGIDRFHPPHQYGSSHGQSRIIRQAYHESPFYVPFVKEAYREWQAIEALSGKSLLLKTGGLMLGAPGSAVISGALLSAQTHNIAYEYLESSDIIKRFPAFKATENTVGVLEKEAGILFPEECIRTYLEQAAANGAQIQFNNEVLAITTKGGITEVKTTNGTYATEKLVLTTGAWTSSFTSELKLPLTVERQLLYWFKNGAEVPQASFLPQDLPIYIWEYQTGKLFYGFPDLGDGIKIAHHHAGEHILPDELSQEVKQSEIDSMRQIVADNLNLQPDFNYASVCMYTNTPDENFIIDFHPDNNNIIIASPCSGHGFKFSSFTGKLLSDMALERSLSFDLSPFSIKRLTNL